jgi:hypothetical protein
MPRLSPVNIVDDVAKQSPYKLRLTNSYRVKENTEIQNLDAKALGGYMLTHVSMGLLPGPCAEGEFALSATLSEQSGKELMRYERRQSVLYWALISSPCGDGYAKRGRKMFPDMLASVYSEVLEDLRQESWLERIPSLRERPFVYVSASKATDIVGKVTTKEKPFPSFTFDQALENDADYKVYIDFSFEGGSPTSLESAFGRGALFVSTLGVISMCPPTELILTAKVMDKTNNERASYRLSDKMRTDWATAECKPHSENTRPQVVADLTSALYKRIRREGILQIVE